MKIPNELRYLKFSAVLGRILNSLYSLIKPVKYRNFSILLALIMLAYSSLMTIPLALIQEFKIHVDDSYKVVLHSAFANKLQFGKDLVYTYGPYGFLHIDQYFPETFKYLLIARLFIGLVLGAVLWQILRHCWLKNRWSVIFLIPLIGFFPNAGGHPDGFIFVVLYLPLLIYFYITKSWRSPILIMAVVAAALGSLIKQTFLSLEFFFILLIAIDEVFRRRRWPIILAFYLFFLFGFWLLAGQNPANIFTYLVNSSEVVRGWNMSMELPGPVSEILWYIISAGAFLSLLIITTWKNRKTGLFPVLSLAAIFFLIFKASFVRHDAHALHAALDTLPLAGLFTALLWPDLARYRFNFEIKEIRVKIPIIFVCWILMLLMSSFILHHYQGRGYSGHLVNGIKSIKASVTRTVQLMTGQVDLQQSLNKSFAKIRAENPLPNLSETADLYPNETAVIFAYGLPYQPRPAFQSLTANSSKQVEMNADHLRASNAPKIVLFDVNPSDDRFPSSDDGLSWPELLTLYDVRDMTGKFLVLQRSPNPRNYSLKTLKKQTAKIGEWVELPDLDSVPIWTRIDARPNWLGKLTNTVYKLPTLYLEVETKDGWSKTYRIIAELMNSGQLLSPVVQSSQDFAMLASPEWQQLLKLKSVKRMRLVTEGWGFLTYPASYSLSLSHLDFPRQEFFDIPGRSEIPDIENFSILLNGTVFNPGHRGLELTKGPEGKSVFLAHAETKIFSPLPKGVQKLSISYGILDRAWQEARTEGVGISVDGVEFRIVAIRADGSEKVLFSRWLDPHANIRDRGVKRTEIDLTGIKAEKIVLETLPGKNSNWDWSYWSEAKIK